MQEQNSMLGSFYDSDMDKETIMMKSNSGGGSIKGTEKEEINDADNLEIQKTDTVKSALRVSPSLEESDSDEETILDLKYDMLKDDAQDKINDMF